MFIDIAPLLGENEHGVVTLRLQWCKLRWQELVQNQKEYWPFRDDPRKLDWAPGVRQKLQQLEAGAEPVVCGAQWLGASQPLRPVMLVDIELGPSSKHHAVLLWTPSAAQVWDFVDLAGAEAPWHEWVLAALAEHMPVFDVPASSCRALDYLMQRLQQSCTSWQQYQEQQRDTAAGSVAARVCHQLVHQKLSPQR